LPDAGRQSARQGRARRGSDLAEGRTLSGLYEDPELAARYARVTAENVCNAAYERPAIRTLLGDVRGLDLLDAGCAAGEHAAWLVEAGATVTALDASAAMIALARARLGSRAKMVCADLAQPLPFADGSFDMVLSSLTLHYLEDWQPTLREFARVLRAGGRLLISTHHPFLTLDAVASYHDVAPIEEMWSGFGDDPVPVRFYHRPFARMVDDLATTGFRLTALREPQPSVEAEARDPALAQQLRTRPQFVILDAVRSD
jgi:SAM-dependent methyltransferase